MIWQIGGPKKSWWTGGNDVPSFYSHRLSYIASKQVCTGSDKAMTLICYDFPSRSSIFLWPTQFYPLQDGVVYTLKMSQYLESTWQSITGHPTCRKCNVNFNLPFPSIANGIFARLVGDILNRFKTCFRRNDRVHFQEKTCKNVAEPPPTATLDSKRKVNDLATRSW